MKEFNIEKAKAGDAVITRDGREARIVCFDRECPNYPLVVLITEECGLEDVNLFAKNGQVHLRSESEYDLFMAPKKVTKWYNVYTACTGNMFCSKDEALECISNNMTYLETRSVTWEE